ncbi:MAG: PQQ-dependent sugar dehydrogenase, partial [Pseudomonadota bacterium]
MSGTISLGATELSVAEQEGSVFVPIVRTGDLSGSARVQYGVTPDSASAGLDYVAQNGFVTFAPGQDRALVEIDILDDSRSEATETFTLSIINVDDGFLAAPRTTRIDILDDENPVQEPSNPPLSSDYDVQQIDFLDGLRQPLAMEFGPDGNVFVAEKGGVIRVFDGATGADKGNFIDLSDITNNVQDRGLMDIALHPNFPDEPFVYAFVVIDPPESEGQSGNGGPNGGGNRYAHVIKFEADASTGFTTAVPGSAEVIVGGAGQSASDISGNGRIDSTSNLSIRASDVDENGDYVQDYIKVDSRSHAGGALEFGPDGALYVSIGDGTSFNATDPRTVSVQDVNSLSGKVLRIDPQTGRGFDDNPFADQADSLDDNAAKVYQLGLRNPFSMSFDQAGKLVITDTGWNAYEEINVGGPGANFGWPFYEGGDNGALLPTRGYRDLPGAREFYEAVEDGDIDVSAAFRSFSHANSAPGFQVQSIVGADDLITSDLYPEDLQNSYIFSDFTQGEVFAVNTNDRRDVEFLYKIGDKFAPVHFKQGPDGLIYAVDVVRGSIKTLQITDPNADAPSTNGVLGVDFFALPSGIANLGQINFNATPIFSENVESVQQSVGTGAFFDGGPTDNFAALYSGTFEVGRGGAHTFYLTSDDGSQLFIDGQRVINNDGVHGDVLLTANVDLDPGEHTIEIRYFERGGLATLDLDWSGPGFGRAAMIFNGDPNGPVDPPAPTPTITGTPGADVIDGTAGNDVIDGLAGRDVILGSAGNDVIDGGDAGYNQIDYDGRSDDYTFVANEDGSVTVVKPNGTDIISNIGGFWFNGEAAWKPLEDLVISEPGDGPNTIIGTDGADFLNGTAGDDIVDMAGGRDVINGSAGNDTIEGGDTG